VHPTSLQNALAEYESTLHSCRGESGSIWKYSGAQVRMTRVTRRFACDFQNNVNFGNRLTEKMQWAVTLSWGGCNSRFALMHSG
jgi:hypothetical protein